MKLDYTFDRQLMLEREDSREGGRAEGLEEGRAEGRAEGRIEGENRLARLFSRLLVEEDSANI